MSIFDMGILLTGASGIGKSELALTLISRGHQLIADDTVNFNLDVENNKLIGTCPPILQDFLEVRDLGILNIRMLFGDSAISQSNTLRLIIQISKNTEVQLIGSERIHGKRSLRNFNGINIPEIMISNTINRNLAILVETIIRNETIKESGYDASLEFTKRQASYLT